MPGGSSQPKAARACQHAGGMMRRQLLPDQKREGLQRDGSHRGTAGVQSDGGAASGSHGSSRAMCRHLRPRPCDEWDAHNPHDISIVLRSKQGSSHERSQFPAALGRKALIVAATMLPNHRAYPCVQTTAVDALPDSSVTMNLPKAMYPILNT